MILEKWTEIICEMCLNSSEGKTNENKCDLVQILQSGFTEC